MNETIFNNLVNRIAEHLNQKEKEDLILLIRYYRNDLITKLLQSKE